MTRVAQALLVLAAGGLWLGSRLTWVEITTFDGLTHPRTTAVSGASWSPALIALALLLLAAAVAALAVRGWALRLLAVLVAAASAGMAYSAISLWAVADAGPRAAALAEVPVADLTGSAERHFTGAAVTAAAALCTLIGAVLLMRSAARAHRSTGKYAAPAARRAAAARADDSDDGMSERMIWDALDEGRDPTRPDNEGR